MKDVTILNSSDQKKTVAALQRAAAKAKGRARATLQSLARGLATNPTTAARSRSAQGGSVKKRTHTRKATTRRHTSKKRTYKRKTNPTTAAAAAPARKSRTHWYHRAKSAVAKARTKVRSAGTSFNFAGLIMEGLALTGGMLMTSFAERQAEKFLPDVNPTLRTLLASGAVGALAWFVAVKLGRKAEGKQVALGTFAETVRSIGRVHMPSLFAGTDYAAQLSAGTYWDAATGQYMDATQYAGIYGVQDEAPLVVRPVGV